LSIAPALPQESAEMPVITDFIEEKSAERVHLLAALAQLCKKKSKIKFFSLYPPFW
jgi:hypothetical protein